MRICGVISSLGSGGAERVMVELCAAWQARGDHVTLLTLDDGQNDFHSVPNGVVRRALNITSRSVSATDAIRANLTRARTLRAALRTSQADVVVSFTDRTNVLVLMAARGLRVPVIVSERIDPRRHEIGSAWNLLRRLSYPSASALVVQTNAVRDWAEDVVAPDRVMVIPNPLRPVAHSPVSAGARAPTIVALGRLVEQKGFDVLIRAFASIAHEFPDWSLTIYGEGTERPSLEQRVHDVQLAERITLPGKTSHVADVLSAASIFVLPSRYEGFPNALLEAMSCGCACVATDCDSGPADLITAGVSGELVPVNDALALAQQLASLMRDDDRRSVLGQQATKSVERFAPGVVLELWDRAFAMVSNAGRAAA